MRGARHRADNSGGAQAVGEHHKEAGSAEVPGSRAQSPTLGAGARSLIVAGWVVLVLFAAVVIADTLLGYVMYNVKPTEVGVQFRASKPFNVVGPGISSDIAPFADIVPVNV